MQRIPYPLALDADIDTFFATVNASGELVAPVLGAGATLVLRRLSDGEERTLTSSTDYVLNADTVDGRHKLLFNLDSTIEDSAPPAKFFVISETYHLMFVTSNEDVTVDGSIITDYPILEFKTAPVGAVNVTHIDGTDAVQTSEPPTDADIATAVWAETVRSITAFEGEAADIMKVLAAFMSGNCARVSDTVYTVMEGPGSTVPFATVTTNTTGTIKGVALE